MKRSETTLIVFARAPMPGRAKTRLIPALGKKGAAALHQRLLENTLDTITTLQQCKLELWCTPDTSHPSFKHLKNEYPLSLHQQQGADLGERMAHAMQRALMEKRDAIIIGTDCPELSADDILQAIDLLQQGYDAVIGPAVDGGYYLLGLKRFESSLFQNIRWGSDSVFQQTLARLDRAGMPYQTLTTKHDLDRPADLEHFPELYSTNHEGN